MGEAVVKVSHGLLESVLFYDHVNIIKVLIQDDDEVVRGVVRFVICGPNLPKRDRDGNLEEVVAVIEKVYERTNVRFTPVKGQR